MKSNRQTITTGEIGWLKEQMTDIEHLQFYHSFEIPERLLDVLNGKCLPIQNAVVAHRENTIGHIVGHINNFIMEWKQGIIFFLLSTLIALLLTH